MVKVCSVNSLKTVSKQFIQWVILGKVKISSDWNSLKISET